MTAQEFARARVRLQRVVNDIFMYEYWNMSPDFTPLPHSTETRQERLAALRDIQDLFLTDAQDAWTTLEHKHRQWGKELQRRCEAMSDATPEEKAWCSYRALFQRT